MKQGTEGNESLLCIYLLIHMIETHAIQFTNDNYKRLLPKLLAYVGYTDFNLVVEWMEKCAKTNLPVFLLRITDEQVQEVQDLFPSEDVTITKCI